MNHPAGAPATGEPVALARYIADGLAQFVADVLRRAHEVAHAREASDEERAILNVALLFANDLSEADPRLDHMEFVASITESR